MEYGKTLGATGSGLVLFGTHIGYGWIILGAAMITASAIILVKLLFRRGENLGQ